MEKTEKLEKDLVNLIENLLLTKEQILKTEDLILPVKPRNMNWYTLKEYEKYSSELDQYEKTFLYKTLGLKQLKETVIALEINIVELLPSSNVWFLLSNGKYAVGHESNDWPGDRGSLFVHVNPDLPSLRKLNHKISS